jgi:glucosamine kinase
MTQAGVRIAELAQALFMLGVRRVALAGGLAEPVKPYLPHEVRDRLAEPKADAMAGGILLAKTRLGALQAAPAEATGAR